VAAEESGTKEEAPSTEPVAAVATPEAVAPAAGPVEIRLGGRTDVGLIREHNEDSFVIVRLDDGVRDPGQLTRHELGERGTLLVVCDGMGGAAAGEVASGMAIESLTSTMLDGHMVAAPEGVVDDERTQLARKLRGAARDANARIFREARENLARSGMGTTMTALHLWRRHALVAQVGDSRAYVWRQGHFTQVTRDQSLVNQLLETGQITLEQAKFFEHSNVILQALGVQEEVEVQLSKVELRRGDRLLLCSDGLVGVVSDEEIAAVMGSLDDPGETARILVEMANAAGGPDNVTVIVAHVDGAGLSEPTSDDVLQFAHWRIDPEPPPPPQGMNDSFDSFGTPPPSPTGEQRIMHHAQPRRATAELMSMAIVVGLILGSMVTGAMLYRHGVRCRVDAHQSGLAVLTDGHDSGARTADGAVELRLSPGHHIVALRGGNGAMAPFNARVVDVVSGEACEVSFTEPAGR
jgi:serine/threonine protein phosphatase PrpC